MSVKTEKTVWCDGEGCAQWVTINVSEVIAARRGARDKGWTTLRRERRIIDLCPDCTKASR